MLVVGENERKLDVMKITHISLGSSFQVSFLGLFL